MKIRSRIIMCAVLPLMALCLTSALLPGVVTDAAAAERAPVWSPQADAVACVGDTYDFAPIVLQSGSYDDYTYSKVLYDPSGDAVMSVFTADGKNDGESYVFGSVGMYSAVYTVADDVGNASIIKYDILIMPVGDAPLVTIRDWTYGGSPSAPGVTGAPSGSTLTYEYKAADADDTAYSEKVPTAAGDYVLRVKLEYIVDGESVTVYTSCTFSIAKAKVEKPSLLSYVVKEGAYMAVVEGFDSDTMDIAEFRERVDEDEGTDFMDAVVRLKDSANYEWSDGGSDDVTLTLNVITGEVPGEEGGCNGSIAGGITLAAVSAAILLGGLIIAAVKKLRRGR